MRLRRARCLTCYWHQDDFVAHPYLHGEPVALPSPVVEILTAFGTWRSPDDAAKALPAYDSETISEAVETLSTHGLLLAEGSEEAAHDEHVALHWDAWAPEASFFHYATRHDTYETLTEEDRYTLVAEGRPALFTSYPNADRILLPRIPVQLSTPLGEALYQRRTHRAFSRQSVPLPSLAALIATVFGPADFIDAGGFGALIRRTSPSGGARQEIDAYLGVRTVHGVAPGWYHYNTREHSLELLAEGCTSDDLATLCGGQEWAGQASFIVILTSVVQRMLVKYRDPRAYRVCLLNAGHFGQSFALAATALGLGPFQTGAFHDHALTQRLGLDGATAIPLYVLGAGPPADRSDAGPAGAGIDAFRRTTL